MRRLRSFEALLSCALLALFPAACGRIAASDSPLGGALADASPQVVDGDGGTTSGVDAGSQADAAPPPTDASTVPPPPPGPAAAFECDPNGGPPIVHLGTFPNAPWDGGDEFVRAPDAVDFFHKLAAASGFDDAARGVHCPKGSDPSACGYDPRLARTSDTETAYSDALQRFTGPDGGDYIWAYTSAQNLWMLADRRTSPKTYAILLAVNQCP